MSIQSEINRIAGAKSDIADAIEGKGVTVPSGTKLNGMANLIGQISGGSEKLNSTQAADAYDPTATYAVGDKVSYAGNVYSCISAISTPEAWDSTHWDQVDPIQDQVDEVKNTLTGLVSAVDTQAFTKAQKAQARGNIGAESSWTRLWENASPNNNFPDQTIAISGMENWSEFRIYFSDYKTSTAPSVYIVFSGFGRGEQWVFNSVKFHYRAVTTSAGRVAFDIAYTFGEYGNAASQYVTVDNGYIIPWYIDGR